jgi:hypothetical protein
VFLFTKIARRIESVFFYTLPGKKLTEMVIYAVFWKREYLFNCSHELCVTTVIFIFGQIILFPSGYASFRSVNVIEEWAFLYFHKFFKYIFLFSFSLEKIPSKCGISRIRGGCVKICLLTDGPCALRMKLKGLSHEIFKFMFLVVKTKLVVFERFFFKAAWKFFYILLQICVD